jgi:hypothetical protein
MIEQEATAWPLLEKKKEKAIGPFYYFFFFFNMAHGALF